MDYDQMLSALTPESQAYHIGLSVFAVSYFFGEEGSEQFLREHGFVAPPSPNQEGELDDTAFVKAMLAIKDPGRLMKKAVDREIWIAAQMAGAIRRKHETADNRAEIVAAVTIKNVSVTGDTAEATVKLAKPAKDALANMRETKLVKFRRMRIAGTAILIRDNSPFTYQE